MVTHLYLKVKKKSDNVLINNFDLHTDIKLLK